MAADDSSVQLRRVTGDRDLLFEPLVGDPEPVPLEHKAWRDFFGSRRAWLSVDSTANPGELLAPGPPADRSLEELLAPESVKSVDIRFSVATDHSSEYYIGNVRKRWGTLVVFLVIRPTTGSAFRACYLLRRLADGSAEMNCYHLVHSRFAAGDRNPEAYATAALLEEARALESGSVSPGHPRITDHFGIVGPERTVIGNGAVRGTSENAGRQVTVRLDRDALMSLSRSEAETAIAFLEELSRIIPRPLGRKEEHDPAKLRATYAMLKDGCSEFLLEVSKSKKSWCPYRRPETMAAALQRFLPRIDNAAALHSAAVDLIRCTRRPSARTIAILVLSRTTGYAPSRLRQILAPRSG